MKDEQFEVEVALRMALLNKVSCGLIGAAASDFGQVKTNFLMQQRSGVGPRLSESVPRIFTPLKIALSQLGLETPGVRPGWAQRMRALLNISAAVATADAADLVEILSHLGSPKVMSPTEWTSSETLENVHVALWRLYGIASELATHRAAVSERWEFSSMHKQWVDSHDNHDFGYSEVLKAASAELGSWRVPAEPAGRGDGPHYLRYWFTLAVFLLGHLGWKSPDVGLARWINGGMRGDNSMLSVVKDAWGIDAAALILASRTGAVARAALLFGSRAILTENAVSKAPLSPGTSALLAEKCLSDRRWSWVNSTESDPLHLEDHLVAVLGRSSDAWLPGSRFVMPAEEVQGRHASLFLAGAQGWYGQLCVATEALPVRSDNRAWRVDVTSATLGYIGEFRRSTATGLWFVGRHSSHVLGNPS